MGDCSMILAGPQTLNLFLLLALGHWVADFPLQTDRIAIEKCPGCNVILPWQWWLLAHSGVHGFFVAWLTQVPILGLLELVLHAIIDIGKCQKKYNLLVDQLLHLSCKLLLAVLASQLVGTSFALT